jgi:sarcosine oxidase/L-pipecolate oxidase
LFYGFPILPWGPQNIARIAVDNAARMITNPKFRKSNSSSIDLDRTSHFVKERCVGTDIQANYAGTCLMSNVSDNNFVLDHLPKNITGHKNVAIYTAGWGFKFAPMIGKVLKELVVDGKTDVDIDHFKISRPDILKDPSS